MKSPHTENAVALGRRLADMMLLADPGASGAIANAFIERAAIRYARELLTHGVPPRQIERALDAMVEAFADRIAPLELQPIDGGGFA